jgi:hypothetical protein
MEALKRKLQAGKNQVNNGPGQYNKVRFLSKFPVADRD